MPIDSNRDIHGSSQRDVLNGGAGNDTMNGGAGSDWVNGAAGDDTLVYNLSGNSAAGTADTYLGGSGKDTLWLQFTRAEWLAHQVQSQLAAYVAHLAAVTNPTIGEVSNGTANDFVFTFGACSLTVQMVESVRVWVDGVEVMPGDHPVWAVADTLAVLEDTPAVDVSVLANDSVPDLVATLALASGPAHGTATLVQPDAGDPSTWYFRYLANAADFQYLAKDETVTDSFTYVVTDANGSTGTATVTIAINGANDDPVVAAADVTGGVIELTTPSGNLTDSGAIAFTDPDASDTHTVGAVTPPAGALGTLTAAITTDTTGSGTGGVLTWNYSVAAAAAESLAAGETKTETFNFDIGDGHGGSVTRIVSVTLTGTNDAPALLDDGLVASEDTAVSMTTGSLLLNDSDVDGDTLTVSLLDGAGTAGSVTLDAGVVTYTAGGAFQYLSAGQTAQDAFVYTVIDGQGGSGSATVHITVQGADDAPTTTPVTLASIAEDSGPRVITQAELLANVQDVDSTVFTASALELAAGSQGTLIDNGDGSWTYTPALNDDTAANFTYTVSDGGLTAAGVASLDITPVPDQMRVAVVYGAGMATSGPVARTVNQLNDSWHFDFSASAVPFFAVDTVAEADQYDAIIIGGEDWEIFSQAFWQTMATYVADDRGGVLTMGHFNIQVATTLPAAWRPLADAVSPTAISPDNYVWGETMFVQNTDHPITYGLSSFPDPSNVDVLWQGSSLLDPTAVGLAYQSGPSNMGGGNRAATIAYNDVAGDGRTAFLGLHYLEQGYMDQPLNQGPYDQLLEQTVAWLVG